MELIDRETFRKRLIAKYHCVPIVGLPYGDNWETLNAALADEPVIAAAPVVHGRWEEVDWVEPDGHGFGTVRIPKAGLMCNQCANVFRKKLLWKDNYCPNCGTRMEGGEGHETD